MERAVEPLANISASELLNLGPALFAWVRKGDNSTTGIRSLVDIGGWPWYYMILRTGCLYLFKKPDSSNFSESIPLTLYRVCDAPDVTKYQWVFKLIHTKEVKTVLFAVDTEFDLKKWKDAIIKDKETFCGSEQSHDYTYIEDDHDVMQRPLPPPPKVDKRERPPASLPTGPTTRTPLRPHSNYEPEPFLGKDQEHSSSPVFPKQKGQILKRPAASLPRRTSTQELPTPSRIPDRKKMSRSSSEACITSKQTQGNDFDNVIKQLQLPKLSLIHEGGTEPPKVPSRPGRGRDPPDGCENERGRHREVSRGRGAPFIPNSCSTEMTKEEAARALEAEPLGTYLTRPSPNSESGRSLSVRDQNAQNAACLVRHYRIFYKETRGYALDTKGPWFGSVPETLEYYHQTALPNTKQKLCYSYVPSLSYNTDKH